MDVNQITYEIRGAIFSVYNELGPGLLESCYEAALFYELQCRGLNVVCQVPVGVTYRGKELDQGYRMDILVENQVVIEIKSAETLHDVHKKQLLTYLRLANKRIGILVNFNTARIQDKVSLVRIAN